jgi:uncharacterized membrane protein YqhA
MAGTLAATAADGLYYLLAVMTYGAEEHPSLQAVEAVPALLTGLVLFMVSGGVSRMLR